MPSKMLIPRIKKILISKGEEMTCYEIVQALKKNNDENKVSSKRTFSFTTQQVAQTLRITKHFEKSGWCPKRGVNLWRNKNVMDGEIQTKETE